VTVNSALSTLTMVFNTSGYTIAAASPTPFTLTVGGGSTNSKNLFLIDARNIGATGTDTISNPITLSGNNGGSYIGTSNTLTFNGTLASGSAAPVFSGNGTVTGVAAAPVNYSLPVATYILNAAATGAFEIGGGNAPGDVSEPALVAWGDTNATDLFGAT